MGESIGLNHMQTHTQSPLHGGHNCIFHASTIVSIPPLGYRVIPIDQIRVYFELCRGGFLSRSGGGEGGVVHSVVNEGQLPWGEAKSAHVILVNPLSWPWN